MIGVLLFVFIRGFSTSRIDAEIAVSAAGHTAGEVKSWAWLACSKDDLYNWHFIAKNSQGNQISGVVCCGLLKSCTVRY